MGIALIRRELSFVPCPNYRVLTSNDQLFIMRDFELLARMEAAYNLKSEDQSILTKIKRPFQEALHLIADPKQIRIMPCDQKNEFGYFLTIPKSADNQHFIHLDCDHAHMIATKLRCDW